MEILIHEFDGEACDEGQDPDRPDLCGHGYRAHWYWSEEVA